MKNASDPNDPAGGKSMKVAFEKVMPPKSGLAAEVKKGQHLRVTDVEGKQVVDMALFNPANPREKLSTSYSRTRYRAASPEPRTFRATSSPSGDTLMSTMCRPMMSFVRGDARSPRACTTRHNRMCNRFLYESLRPRPARRLPRDHRRGGGARVACCRRTSRTRWTCS